MSKALSAREAIAFDAGLAAIDNVLKDEDGLVSSLAMVRVTTALRGAVYGSHCAHAGTLSEENRKAFKELYKAYHFKGFRVEAERSAAGRA